METNEAAVWDAVAGEYQRVFKLGKTGYQERLFRYWEQNGMLRPGCRVLDIGCGVGKYGVLFAELGCDVTLTDISSEMLRNAAENMSRFSTPWKTFTCDFKQVSPDEPVFAEGFDLSISTMSPAVCDAATVRKMSAMTRGWCFLSRFRSWEQPLRDELLRRLEKNAVPLFADPAGDCDAMIRAVREAGFDPQLSIAEYNWCDKRTPAEMASVLQRYLPDSPVGAGEIERVAGDLIVNGTLDDAVFTTVAWISWKSGNGPA